MEKNKESVHGQGSKKPPDEGGSDDTQKQYFKERLIRKTSMPTETKEPLKNGMTHLDYEGGSHLLPNFMLTPIAFEQLCLPWKQCLIVKEKMVSERPWVIFDHYLIVSMDFEVHTVRSNNEQNLGIGLGKVYYEENVLFTIASAIGTPIKVDKSTLNMHHG
ncbi:hypothetical protein HKD37_10G028079 [Glycine soja]